MQIKEVSKLNQPTEQELLTIWENSVRATHKFLNNDEILQIRNYVPQAFKQVEHLLVIIDHEQIKGFMGINDQKVEMLSFLTCLFLSSRRISRSDFINLPYFLRFGKSCSMGVK